MATTFKSKDGAEHYKDWGAEAYGTERPEVAGNILVTPRLALPAQLIEIKFIARV